MGRKERVIVAPLLSHILGTQRTIYRFPRHLTRKIHLCEVRVGRNRERFLFAFPGGCAPCTRTFSARTCVVRHLMDVRGIIFKHPQTVHIIFHGINLAFSCYAGMLEML